MTLENHVVWITGGSRGLGLETARAFLEKGARVFISCHTPEHFDKALSSLQADFGVDRVSGQLADARSYDQVQRASQTLAATWRAPDILINNAAVAYSGSFIGQDITSIREIVETNLLGYMHHAHAVLPGMKEGAGGIILNIIGPVPSHPFPSLAVYNATKQGLTAFTESLAQEVRPAGIRVYGIAPEPLNTDLQKKLSGLKMGLEPYEYAKRVVAFARNPHTQSGESAVIIA